MIAGDIAYVDAPVDRRREPKRSLLGRAPGARIRGRGGVLTSPAKAVSSNPNTPIADSRMAISILATAPLDANTTYGDFRDALARDGFVVVPGVIEPKAAGAYVSQCHSWVESFELGYKRDDPATHRVECVPNSFKGPRPLSPQRHSGVFH